jgi:hypothetical protein
LTSQTITKQKKEEAAQDNVENARENLMTLKKNRCKCKEATHEEWDGAKAQMRQLLPMKIEY